VGLADELDTDSKPRKFSTPTSEKSPVLGTISCSKFTLLTGDTFLAISFDPQAELSI
jgi:hypothetical protein